MGNVASEAEIIISKRPESEGKKILGGHGLSE